MTALTDLVAALKGYRTYLAATSAMLTSVATWLQLVDPSQGTAVALAMMSAAQIFQRMATAELLTPASPAQPPPATDGAGQT
jgi:hypothetical protein